MIFIMVWSSWEDKADFTLDTEFANVPFHHEIEKRLRI